MADGHPVLLLLCGSGNLLDERKLEPALKLGGVDGLKRFDPVLVVLGLEVVEHPHELVEDLFSLVSLASVNEVL